MRWIADGLALFGVLVLLGTGGAALTGRAGFAGHPAGSAASRSGGVVGLLGGVAVGLGLLGRTVGGSAALPLSLVGAVGVLVTAAVGTWWAVHHGFAPRQPR